MAQTQDFDKIIQDTQNAIKIIRSICADMNNNNIADMNNNNNIISKRIELYYAVDTIMHTTDLYCNLGVSVPKIDALIEQFTNELRSLSTVMIDCANNIQSNPEL
jgi:hypothetical protein